MTKKELHQKEVAERNEIRRIAKEKRDAEKAKKKAAWEAQKAIWAQKKLDKAYKAKILAEKKALVIQRKHEFVFDGNLSLIEKIKQNILKGDTNEVIRESLFFEIRNASFALSASQLYSLSLPDQGPVQEHVNGRTNVGIYCLWLILNKEIKDWKDLYQYLLKFACWIKTTKDFNNHISLYQNGNEGAINPKDYIREYENEFNYKFTKEEKTQFKDRCLSTHYGQITKDMIIDAIRESK